jgi:hypothetical protein
LFIILVVVQVSDEANPEFQKLCKLLEKIRCPTYPQTLD